MIKIEIGDSYRFTPYCMVYSPDGRLERAKPLADRNRVEGRVVMINRAHHWFRVRYRLPGVGVQHECFPLKEEAESGLQLETKHGYQRVYRKD